jgi:glutamyl-Q tRNA(Asp) synthetase
MPIAKKYRGRFAPSPTGPLHFGSLIAAMGSYLQAKHQQGEWLLRIDDIDPPREQKGAKEAILRTLEDFGFEWDSAVFYQSSKLQHYQEAVNDLIKQQRAYACSCSKKSLIKQTGQTEGEIVYPGFCRDKSLEKSPEHSIRLRCNSDLIHFNDAIQGKQAVNLEKLKGDFVIQRRDQHFSYQLATGIDDAEQKITEVVRGADLLNCTPCQLHVQHMLNLPSPQYCHLPIAMNDAGQKLSKQHHATPLTTKDSVLLLYKALKFLGQKPPIDVMNSNQEELWLWAKTHWRLDLVAKINPNII